MQIVGTITLTTHAHQTAPDGRDGNRNETIKTYLFSADGRRRKIPFITANSIRGVLRRCAADRTMDALNQPISRQLFHNLTRGAADRSGIGETPTVEAMTSGNRHVFAGLFGGGPYMLHSRYTMGPLIPMVAWCSQLLHPALKDAVIPADQLRGLSADGQHFDADLTTEIILTGRDDLLAGKGEARIENYQESLQAWLGQVSGGNAAKAETKAAKAAAKKTGIAVDPALPVGKSSDLRSYNFIEALLPGTPLQFWLRLKSASTPAQVGLMLMAVRDWANANALGGASARGFGRFNAQLALYDGDRLVAPSLFNLTDHATSYTLSADVASYVAAAQAELAKLTVADLERVYPSRTGAVAEAAA